MTATMQGILLSLAIYYEVQSHKNSDPDGRPKSPDRTPNHLYANGFDNDVPGMYSNHPERYANNQDDLGDIMDRQEADAAADTTPLLKPGGIGDPHRNYDTNRG